ncbi:hypothetical protein FHX42_002365 [Saccharopolyspora lacisalsi]|uniref:TIR domain-containing protein n=1 Tax=Halosaccharopolyspora lacisalsi TaxID=1000566 RepID=A0A839E250_9PSEU|nr:TIR domain-containing protein [Halosaccharopolyspora lacisalsi]MBA8825018.1 hypothetical protein [Halosaccharopolyspora lacisalsi]
MPEVFVSYRTGDGENVATLIERDLSHRFGDDRVFRDGKSIRSGATHRDVLSGSSAETKVLLVVIGAHWLSLRDEDGDDGLDDERNRTREEILDAFECGARVVPVLCGRTVPPLSPTALPTELAPLADHQFLRFDTGDTETDLGKIAAELVDLVPGLTDRTARSDSGGTRNSLDGCLSGVAIRAGDQCGGPAVHGDGAGYVAGANTGGTRQNFGTSRAREGNR